ncbi:hypothetical protein ES703_71911 [subsurface metagenome]
MRSERQKPHSPERHCESTPIQARSRDTKTDSVADALIVSILFPILTVILNIFSLNSTGYFGFIVIFSGCPYNSLLILLFGMLRFLISFSKNSYIACGPHIKNVFSSISPAYFLINSAVIKPERPFQFSLGSLQIFTTLILSGNFPARLLNSSAKIISSS